MKKIIERDMSQSVIGHCFKILWHQKFLKRAHNPGLKTEKKNHSSMSKHIRRALPFMNYAKHLVRPCCYIFIIFLEVSIKCLFMRLLKKKLFSL